MSVIEELARAIYESAVIEGRNGGSPNPPWDEATDQMRGRFILRADAALALLASREVADDAGPPCKDCNGRGWHRGDCHPRETCGTCLGSGRSQWPALLATVAALRAERDAAKVEVERLRADAERWRERWVKSAAGAVARDSVAEAEVEELRNVARAVHVMARGNPRCPICLMPRLRHHAKCVYAALSPEAKAKLEANSK